MVVEPIPDGSPFAPHHFHIGIMLAWFSFIFVWWAYPRTGATLTLVGLAIAVDDAVQHAFGVETPLHHLWWGVMYPVIRLIESA